VRYEVWEDEHGKVTRYTLAYINPLIIQKIMAESSATTMLMVSIIATIWAKRKKSFIVDLATFGPASTATWHHYSKGCIHDENDDR